MRSFRTLSCLLFCILWAIASIAPSSAAEQQEQHNQAPYVFHTAMGSPIRDILEARIKEAFHRMGLEAELTPTLSSQRAIMLANQDGDGDAARVANIKEIAPQNTGNLLKVREPIVTMALTVYTKNLDFPVEGWHSLVGYHNGARVGAKILEKNIPGQRSFVPSTEQLVRLLDSGRIDTMVEWNLIADTAIKDAGITGIKKLSPALTYEPFFLYLHKRHEALLPRLTQVLAQMKEDGTFEKIRTDILGRPSEYVFYHGSTPPVIDILNGRLQEAFRRIGKKCRVVYAGSAQRSLIMANEEGDGDAMRVADIKQLAPRETDSLLQIPESIYTMEYSVYTKKKAFPVTGWQAMDGYTNGFRVGVKILEINMPGHPLLLPNTERLFLMLNLGRIDTVVELNVLADSFIRQEHLAGINKLSPPLVSVLGYTFIHKKHRQLVPRIADALAAMKKDGSFMKIQADILQKTAAP